MNAIVTMFAISPDVDNNPSERVIKKAKGLLAVFRKKEKQVDTRTPMEIFSVCSSVDNNAKPEISCKRTNDEKFVEWMNRSGIGSALQI